MDTSSLPTWRWPGATGSIQGAKDQARMNRAETVTNLEEEVP